jgi:AcrR family transcriptional regulator
MIPQFVNSRFMKPLKASLNPIKTPVQARAVVTLEAIFEGTIQVLLTLGVAKITTTKVAERAGVSVGTLYQYFPNKTSLLAALLQRHLLQVVMAVEAACEQAKGQALDVMARTVVEAFMRAKFEHADLSRALYAVAAELDGQAVVAAMTQRSQIALCDLLASQGQRRFHDLKTVSFVLSTALVGPVQALLALNAPAHMQAAISEQLVILVQSYLQEASQAR